MVNEISIERAKKLLGKLQKIKEGKYNGNLCFANGESVDFIVNTGANPMNQVLENLSFAINEIHTKQISFKLIAAADVLDYYNDNIALDRDLPRLSVDELSRKLELSGITFYDNELTLYYDSEDEVFGGHSVELCLNGDGSKQYEAEIVG